MFTELVLNTIIIISFTMAGALTFLDINANIGEYLLKRDNDIMNSNVGIFLLFNIFIRDSLNDYLNDLVEGGKEWILKYLQMVVRSRMNKKKQGMTVQQHLLFGKMVIK